MQDKFSQRQIAEIKELLRGCTDEQLYDLFKPVYDVVKEKLMELRERPPAVYSNHSPLGIADELHKRAS